MLCEGWRKTTLASQTVGLDKKLLTAFEILFFDDYKFTNETWKSV